MSGPQLNNITGYTEELGVNRVRMICFLLFFHIQID